MELGRLWYTLALEGMDEFQSDVNSTQSNTENSSNKIVDSFKKIGAAIATYLTVQTIVDFGKSVVDAASTVSAETSAFEQIMGDYSSTAQEKMKAVADSTGVVDTRLTTYMTSMTAKFKGLGFDIDDATTLAADGLTLASDAAAFWDKSLDDSMSALNSFVNGSYEGGEAIGLFANDTQMAQFAVQQGIVDSTSAWSSLDEATKQATRLEYAQKMYEQSGATGQAAKEANQYANVQANLTEKWRQFKAQIGEPILQNIVLPAMQKLSDLIDILSKGFQDATQWVSEHKTAMEVLKGVVIGLTTAVGAFVLIINFGSIMSAATTALGKVKTAMLSLNTTMAANPIGLVVAAIAGLVAAFIYLWNNCEEFRNFWTGVWKSVQSVASTVINAIVTFFTTTIPNALNSLFSIISSVFNSIATTVSTIVNAIATVISTVWNAIKAVTSTVFNGIKTVTTTVWNGIKTAITTVINGIKTGVSTVFNGIKTTISTIWNGIKSVTTTVWNGIKTAITTPMNTAKNLVKGVIDAIKGFFNFKISWPHIPLPHFSVKPKGWSAGDLLKGKIPSLGIDWYAKGGIMNDPTVFGYNPSTNRLQVGGEAGAEAIAPIDTLLGYVQTAVAQQNEGLLTSIDTLTAMLADYLPQLVSKDSQLVLDTGVLVGQTAHAMNEELGHIYTRNGRGG